MIELVEHAGILPVIEPGRYTMRRSESHGRLGDSEVARIDVKKTLLLLLSLGCALGAGLHLGLQTTQAQKERLHLVRTREASIESRLLNESLWTTLDSIHAQALAVRQLREIGAKNAAPSGAIVLWAELSMMPGQAPQVRQWIKNPAFAAGSLMQDESVLRDILARLNPRTLSEQQVSVARVQRDPQGAAEWLAVAFSMTPTSAVMALVDPAEVFAVFKHLGDGHNGLRAYLIGSEGRVLAHSLPTYVSADFRAAPIYRDALRAMMTGQTISGAGAFTAIDRLPVVAAYQRVGTLPLGLVVENVLPADYGLPLGLWESLIGQFLAIAGALVVVALAWGALAFRKGKTAFDGVLDEATQKTEEVEAPALAIQPAAVPPPVPTLSLLEMKIQDPSVGPAAAVVQNATQQRDQQQAAEQALRRELALAQETLRKTRMEETILTEFEREAASLRDPKSVAHRLTQTAAKLCGSPSLFFTYHDGIRAAVLRADAGFGEESPSGMSFPMDNALMERIVQSGQKGENASLADYEPLAKLLLARTGVAHYEAWALTGYSHLGRLAGRPRLLGVLVILQGSAETVARRESLYRMMRTSGLIYENSILSQ